MEQQALPSPTRSSGFFALVRNRDYALLWTSQGISLLGDRFHWVAISLWVYALTGSALSVSYAVIALMIGPAAVGLFAGVLVDRWNRKWTMIFADVARGILVAVIPLLMSHDIKWVYLDLFLVSCATAFFRPAMLATIPQIVDKKDLMPANSFFTTVDTATEVAGPVLAGLLVQSSGYAPAMYIDAVTYFASAGLLLVLSARNTPPVEVSQRGRQVLADIREGFRFIRDDRLQLGLLALILLGWWVSGLNSLQTPLAKGVLGLSDQGFGWFNGVWGIGFVLASLILGWYGTIIPKGRLIAVGFVGWGIATAASGLSLNAGMLFAAIFWVGVSNIVLFVSTATTIMEVTPQRVLGRVLTTRQVALASVRVGAMLGFGAVADIAGIRLAVVAMAVVSILGVVVGLLLFPEILRLGTERKDEAPQSILREPLHVRARHWTASVLIGSVDANYGPNPQRMLNAAILTITSVAWIALLVKQPQAALYISALVAGAILFRIVQSTWGTVLGSKNELRATLTTDGRDLEEGRRSPVSTGPTPER